ncbi:MAG: hypothetical protein ACODAD_02330 [Planctomycetota bacterium]
MTDKHRPGKQLHPGGIPPRFHHAHLSAVRSAGDSAAADPSLLAAVAGKGDGVSEQLRQQAAELAEHLRERHGQLTRRQAGLNARLGEYEAEQRATRLWLRERHHELDLREAELQEHQRQLQEQGVQSRARDQTMESLARREEQVRQSEQAVETQHRQLDVELENVREQQAWLEAARTSWQHQCQEEKRTLDELRNQVLDQRQAAEDLNARLRDQVARNQRDSERVEHLNQREQHIEIEAVRMREQQAALEQQRQKWARDQELQAARTAQQRQTIAACWRRRHRELQRERQQLKDRRQTLADREEKLRQQQENLEAYRRDIGQRELVVQHAYDVLRRQIQPEEFSRLEQAVREHLQRQSTIAEKTMAARKRELHQLADSLRQQQEALKIRSARLHSTMARRQRELDAKADELELHH